MKRLISISLTVLIVFCMLVATDRRAWGYIDPGSGLVALQTAGSVALASLYVVRRRIRDFFTRQPKNTDEATPSESATKEETSEVA
jgi:hypothetical protein